MNLLVLGNREERRERRRVPRLGSILWFLGGVGCALLGYALFGAVDAYTSSSEYCAGCHEMAPFVEQWQHSTHYQGDSEMITDCVECHLPPSGFDRLHKKVRLGARDLWVHYTGDLEGIDWQGAIRQRALGAVGDNSCISCHDNLIVPGLSATGKADHEAYVSGQSGKRCVDCHFNLVHVPWTESNYELGITN